MEKTPPHTQLADTELVTGYKTTGDQQWLASLYQRYAGLIFGVALKYLKSPELARDACADIYEELVGKLQKHDVENFKSWLHVLTKNHCLQKLRSGKHLVSVEMNEGFMQSDEALHLEEVMAKEASLEIMEDCLQQLNPDQKKMVDLFYLQEKCYNEIVEITGYSWNMVRSHIQNGRRNLKICMEQKTSE